MDLRTLFATMATGRLRTPIFPVWSTSRMKFAVACRSIAEGGTGTMMQLARSSISWSTVPEAPAGASMMSWRVSAGTYIAMLRRRVPFCRAAFAPWILLACGGRRRSQFRLDPCGS
jgi:hypothetical protein